ncbi:MAG: hypothetical protein ACK5PS_02170 [Desulfopila sp.]
MKSISPIQQITPYSRRDQDQGQSPAAALSQAGKVLKATVLERLPNNTFLLQVGENRLTARSEIPMRTGQDLQLQLLTSSPQITFKVVDATLQHLFNRPLTLIGQPIDIASLAALVRESPSLSSQLSATGRQTLEQLASQQQQLVHEGITSGSLLKQILDSLGLAFEKMLAQSDGTGAAKTLKATLLELATIGKSGQLSDTFLRHLSTLEFFQLAQLQSQASQHFISPLPLPFLEQGFLTVEQSDPSVSNNDYAGQEYRFSLFLRVTPLGNLRIDLFHNREGLSIRFLAEDQDKADFLDRYSKDLRENITESPVQRITFAAGAPDPATELIHRLVPEGHSVFQTTI